AHRHHPELHSFPTRRSSDLENPYYNFIVVSTDLSQLSSSDLNALDRINSTVRDLSVDYNIRAILATASSSDQVDHINDQMDLVRSEEHTSELQSRENLVCRL